MVTSKKSRFRTPLIVALITAASLVAVALINLVPSLALDSQSKNNATRVHSPGLPSVDSNESTIVQSQTAMHDSEVNEISSVSGNGNRVTQVNFVSAAKPETPLVEPTPTTSKFGPFPICKSFVETNLTINKGEVVHVVSEGTVDFGGAVLGIGAPKLDANGDNNDQGGPSDYPAPALMKNSLICKVGPHWYQGGTDRSFTVAENGLLVLACNDAHREDNSRGWQVTVYVTR